jgi:hypothetical protein
MAAPQELEKKLKTALDETRLLILGAQVLFGFQFNAVFQELFKDVPRDSQLVQCGGLILMLLSVGLLIAPSLYHQIVFLGEPHYRALALATTLTDASLLPLALGLGTAAFVIFEHLFGHAASLAVGTLFTAVALALWYGVGRVLRHNRAGRLVASRRDKMMPSESARTALPTKIEQMLTEARVIIPGGQALLGFQFVATLTTSFRVLPAAVQYVHAAGLCAVALAVILLMMPAALHRIAYNGEDDEDFLRIGSRIVVAATWPLAIGITADVAVVFYKVTSSAGASTAAGILSLCVLLGMWFAYPAFQRMAVATKDAPTKYPRDKRTASR